MIMGVIFAHKRYPLVKYFCILLIVLGVAGFMYKDGKADAAHKFEFGWGQILLVSCGDSVDCCCDLRIFCVSETK